MSFSIDSSMRPPWRPRSPERRTLYGRVQQRIAELAPYISLWYETNIAIADPQIKGVHLTPQGDFSFLRNVSR